MHTSHLFFFFYLKQISAKRLQLVQSAAQNLAIKRSNNLFLVFFFILFNAHTDLRNVAFRIKKDTFFSFFFVSLQLCENKRSMGFCCVASSSGVSVASSKPSGLAQKPLGEELNPRVAIHTRWLEKMLVPPPKFSLSLATSDPLPQRAATILFGSKKNLTQYSLSRLIVQFGLFFSLVSAHLTIDSPKRFSLLNFSRFYSLPPELTHLLRPACVCLCQFQSPNFLFYPFIDFFESLCVDVCWSSSSIYAAASIFNAWFHQPNSSPHDDATTDWSQSRFFDCQHGYSNSSRPTPRMDACNNGRPKLVSWYFFLHTFYVVSRLK